MPAADAADQGVRPAFGRLVTEVPATGESFHALASPEGVRVEHIVSSETPDSADQVQDWDEWVLVISGGAQLDVAGERVDVTAGDWLLLPSGTVHRVVRAQAGTHWIAVHGPAHSMH